MISPKYNTSTGRLSCDLAASVVTIRERCHDHLRVLHILESELHPGFVQQGYLSSEPFAIQKGGVEPNVFLLSDYGYPPYATTIETTTSMIEERPDVVKRFVRASMEGWKSYLENPEAGNKLIMEENPEMTRSRSPTVSRK